jgi:predicted TIM-barrel fold metal-dependent hydrolase
MGSVAEPILGVVHTPPAFAVPRGACDCHVHVFGPADRYPFAGTRRYTPGDASVEDLAALHRALQIERTVVVQPSPYGTDNAGTLDALRRLGSAARGVAVIDDSVSAHTLADMQAAGIRGVRVNLETQGESDPAVAGHALQAAAARVAPLDWHVQTYTNIAVLSALHDLILALPVTLVIDHFGHPEAARGTKQPGFDSLLALVRSGKVYVKISAAYRISRATDCADVAPLARALIEANPDRIVWGSDWPHTDSAKRDPAAIQPFYRIDDGMALNRLAQWAGNAMALRKILVDNPARLYQF